MAELCIWEIHCFIFWNTPGKYCFPFPDFDPEVGGEEDNSSNEGSYDVVGDASG